MNIIKRLNWDSDFFGFEIGILTDFEEKFDLLFNDNFKLIIAKCNDFDLERNNFCIKHKWSLVDVKCNYMLQIKKDSFFEENNEFIFEKNDLLQLNEMYNLAFESGMYSRFKVDPNFKNNEFEKLYKEWVKKSILDQNTRTLVYVEDSIIKGFITFEITVKKIIIGLFAVNENYRKQGLGKILINYVVNYAIILNINSIQVSTQNVNKIACNFYEKNNFQISSKENIYHLWRTKK